MNSASILARQNATQQRRIERAQRRGGRIEEWPLQTQPGAFYPQIILDSGNPTKIRIGKGWIFAGTTGAMEWDPALHGDFDETTDIDGCALAAGTYYLCFVIDVNPEDGAFNLASGYGPELVAVKAAGIGALQGHSKSTFTGRGDLPCAGMIVAKFEVDASKHFSDLRRRRWEDINVPTYGFLGTGTGEGEITYWHPFDNSLDGSGFEYWECSWAVDLLLVLKTVSRWMKDHSHDVDGSSGSAGDPAHSHTDGSYETGGPLWI